MMSDYYDLKTELEKFCMSTNFMNGLFRRKKTCSKNLLFIMLCCRLMCCDLQNYFDLGFFMMLRITYKTNYLKRNREGEKVTQNLSEYNILKMSQSMQQKKIVRKT